MAVVRTHQQEVVELPRDKTSVLKVLRRHGLKGLAVDLIEEPRQQGAVATARVYCLTQKKLGADNTMKRRAVTVVFVCHPDDRVAVLPLNGWQPRDLTPEEIWA